MTDPTKYHKSSNILYSAVHHFINEFEEEIRNMSGKCMDIGCGPGDVTKYILLPALNPKATIVGTDISQDMVKYANEVHGNNERLKFYVMDIQTECLPEKYISEFDHVFTIHCLHWCNNIQQTVKNIRRILRPGGTILALMVISHDIYEILYKMSQDIRYKPYITHETSFLPPFYDSAQPHKELKELFRSVGFHVLHCSQRERTYLAQNEEEFTSLMLSFIVQFMEKMPYYKKEQFKNEFMQEYLKRRFYYKRIRDKNETIVSDLHEIIVLHAQKDNNV